MARELHTLGLLTSIDLTALAAYCEAFATWVIATENCRKLGLIVKSPSGYPIQNPYLSVANQAAKQMHRWLTEFGMTPSSRSRISVDTQGEAGDDPYAALLSMEWRVADEQR